MVHRFTLQSLFFFLVLGILGTLLRLKMALPFLPDVRTDYLLHAHSHIAVLGWTNVAFIALIIYFTFQQIAAESRSLKLYFWMLLIVNLGIAPSFMAQGYGVVSIIFSTLSVVLSIWFMVIYFQSQQKGSQRSPLYRFFTTGVIFYVLSAAGLVMVAIHMAAKIGGEELFNAGVYFYLHSQYNGWMVFILIGTVYAYLQKRVVAFSAKSVKWQWTLLTLSFLPTYIPQIYSLQLPAWIIAIGFGGTLLAFIAIVLFLQNTFIAMLGLIINKWIRLLFGYAMLALFFKSLMEIGAAIPFLAEMVHKNRQVVIGYLHLTLLALITSYLFFSIYQYILQKEHRVRVVTLLYIPTTLLMVVTLFFDGLLQWLQIYTNRIPLNIWLSIISGVVTVSGVVVFMSAKTSLRK